MPHLVEMQHKHGKDGLVAVTVNIDEDKVEKEKSEKFLRENKIAVTNVLLDGSKDDAIEKLRVESLPTVFVFNRQGKYVRFPNEKGDPFEHADVEKVVLEFLKEK
jgi:hypothetical protein